MKIIKRKKLVPAPDKPLILYRCLYCKATYSKRAELEAHCVANHSS